MNLLVLGLFFVGFGLIHQTKPYTFLRSVFTDTVFARLFLTSPAYQRYVTGAGIFYIALGFGLITYFLCG